jgi:drug/metabolite transporter (DMT)-like permease
MCVIIIVRRHKIPRDWRTLGALAIIGIFNTAVPFTIISYAEERIPSGLASVLQATTALFGLVIAHFAFDDERITPKKVAGLITGFIGVVVLASRDWHSGDIFTTGFIGQLMMVVASLFYALFATYSRTVLKGNIEPTVVAGLSMLSAALFEAVVIFGGSFFFDIPTHTPANCLLDFACAGLFKNAAAPTLRDPIGVFAFHRRRLAVDGQCVVLDAALTKVHRVQRLLDRRDGLRRRFLHRGDGRTAERKQRDGCGETGGG